MSTLQFHIKQSNYKNKTYKKKLLLFVSYIYSIKRGISTVFRTGWATLRTIRKKDG